MPLEKMLLNLLLIFVVLFNFGRLKYKRILSNFLVIFIPLDVIYLLLSFFFIYNFRLPTFLNLLIDPILLIIYFFENIKNNNISCSIFYKIENVVLFISLVTIPFWILSILQVPTNMSAIIKGWGNTRTIDGYFGIYFLTQGYNNILGFHILRNSSIFVEPSMYSYILLISFLIELFLKHNKRIFNWRTLLLLFSIFTTVSTTGIIISILAIIYKMLISNNNYYLKMIFMMFIPFILIIVTFIFLDKYNSGPSYSLRINDISATISDWGSHLFFGSGITNSAPIQSRMAIWRITSFNKGIEGISTGFTTMLAYGGIPLGLFYLLPSIFACRVSKSLCGIASFTFIVFIFVSIQFTFIYIILLSYFWAMYLLNNHYRVVNLIY